MLFLINLESAHERRAHMTRQLAAHGLACERIGIDFRQLQRERIGEELSRRFPMMRFDLNRISGPEAGCWASHLTAWETLLASDQASAIVLEDDVVLKDDFAEVAAACLASTAIAASFDVLYLGTSSRNISRRRRLDCDGLTVHRPLGAIFNTWAYLAQRSWVEQFFARPRVFNRPIDHVLGSGARRGPRIGVVQPCVVFEDARLGRRSQIGPFTHRIDRSVWVERARRALLESRLSDLYYRAVYRLL